MNKTDWLKYANIPEPETYDKIFKFDVSDWVEISTTSSKGDQRKWRSLDGSLYIKEQLFGDDIYWKDNIIEVLASDILYQVLPPWRFADYYKCTICNNGKITQGCVSSNFLLENNDLITLNRLMNKKSITWVPKKSMRESWMYLCDVAFKASGLDCTEYLALLLVIDFLVLNTDRHLNNIAFTYNYVNGAVDFAPMFDFGRGLLEGDETLYAVHLSTVLNKVRLKPFGFKAESVIDNVLTETNVGQYLPKYLDITTFEFPRFKSKELFKLLCSKVDIKVKGDSAC